MHTTPEIRVSWLLATVVVAAIAAVTVSAILLQLIQEKEDPHLVHIGSQDALARSIPPPLCDSRHRFCITHNASGDLVALYTYDPHIRETRPCEVAWHADRQWEVADDTTIHGTFDDPCGGSVYDITGHRLFGPTPRDLDSFPVTISNDNRTVVDTRILICGKQRGSETHDCERAPLGD